MYYSGLIWGCSVLFPSSLHPSRTPGSSFIPLGPSLPLRIMQQGVDRIFMSIIILSKQKSIEMVCGHSRVRSKSTRAPVVLCWVSVLRLMHVMIKSWFYVCVRIDWCSYIGLYDLWGPVLVFFMSCHGHNKTWLMNDRTALCLASL